MTQHVIRYCHRNLGTYNTLNSVQLSDHYWIHCSLLGKKPLTVQKKVHFRKFKSIDMKQLEEDILDSKLMSINATNTITEAVQCYNSEFTSLLDKHAPLLTKTITLHPDTPWYNDEIDIAKKKRRHAERTWRKTQLTVHREIFLNEKQNVNNLITSSKQKYYNKLISESSNQKNLFKIVDKLSHKKTYPVLPDHTSSEELANRFGEFFNEKIVKIRSKLTSASDSANLASQDDEQLSPTSPSPPCLEILTPTTTAEVRKIIMNSKATTCKLDPIPTSLLKILIDVLLPILTIIVNLSFEDASFPLELKKALIIPLLKKLGIDPEIFNNFRPVSNLPYLSKLIERISAIRLLDHMSINNLHEIFQSSYKRFHSTETALLRVQSDILSALDKRQCVLLILLDLSAAFDTIDHSTLLQRLKSSIGLSGKALQWFSSYISCRKQSVLVNGEESRLWDLLYGVPQGSVLGPILFIIYTSPLGKILRSLNVNYHFYADDTQLYVTFDLDCADTAITKMENAISMIRDWMSQNFLCLNDNKTEVLLVGSKHAHSKLKIPFINIGNEHIIPSVDARNIGFIFDNVMNCHKQVQATCKAAWFHLRNIGRIRKYIDKSATERLVHAFITSKLDINNCLLYGLPANLIQKLQHIQNAAARIIVKVPKYSRITPTLKTLHWLPVSQRITYKILLIVFKSLHHIAPLYIQELLQHRPNASHSLRSNDQNLLVCPRYRSATYGDRNFCNIAPVLWNTLPTDMRMCEDLVKFKKLLKTRLFAQAYN